MKKSDIAASFGRSAKNYDSAALLQKSVGEKLLSHLNNFSIYPETILDLGSGTGYLTKKISRRFPDAHILSLDLSYEMLKFSSNRYPICADADALPLKSHSVDLIFSNLMLQWSQNLSQTFDEIKRIINPSGYFMFTTLGSETLREWRSAWKTVDEYPHVHEFHNKNTIERKLKSSGFSPVFLETSYSQLKFSSLQESMNHTRQIGAYNLNDSRHRGLMGKNKFRQFISVYENFRDIEGHFPVTYEVITCIAKVFS